MSYAGNEVMSYAGNEAYLMVDGAFVENKNLIFRNINPKKEEEKTFRPMDVISGAKIKRMMLGLRFSDKELIDENLAHSEQRMLAYAMDLLETGYYNEHRPLNLKILTRRTCCPMCYEAIKRFKDKYKDAVNLEVIDFGQKKNENKLVPCFWNDNKQLINPEAMRYFYSGDCGREYNKFFEIYEVGKYAVKYYDNNIFKNFFHDFNDEEKKPINEKVNVDDKLPNENIKTFDYITNSKPKTYRGNILYTLESLKDDTGNPTLQVNTRIRDSVIFDKYIKNIEFFKEKINSYNKHFNEFKEKLERLKEIKKQFEIAKGIKDSERKRLETEKGLSKEIEEDKKHCIDRFLSYYELANNTLEEIDEKLGFSSFKEIEKTEEIKKKIEDKISQLEDKKTELEDKKTELEDKKTELEGKKTELEGKKTELEEQKKGLEGEKTELEGKNWGLIKDVKPLIISILKTKKRELKKGDSERKTIAKKIKKAIGSKDVVELRGLISNIKTQKKGSKISAELNKIEPELIKIETNQREIETNQREIEANQREIEANQRETEANQREIEKYTTYKEIRETLKKIDVLKKIVAEELEKNQHYEEYKQKKEELRKLKEEYNNKKQELQQTIKELESRGESLNKDYNFVVSLLNNSNEQQQSYTCHPNELIYRQAYSFILDNIKKEFEEKLATEKEILNERKPVSR